MECRAHVKNPWDWQAAVTRQHIEAGAAARLYLALRQRSSEAEQRFRKPLAEGSTPSAGSTYSLLPSPTQSSVALRAVVYGPMVGHSLACRHYVGLFHSSSQCATGTFHPDVYARGAREGSPRAGFASDHLPA